MMYLTLEGPDGVGKTTQAEMLVNTLRQMGHDVLHVRQPGTSDTAKRLRALILDPELDFERRTEQLLFASAWLDVHTTVIIPALQEGRVVVSERGIASSYSYQHVARMDRSSEWGLLMMYLKQVLSAAESTLLDQNSRCAILTCNVETARERVERRGQSLDRMEQMDETFFARVRHGFDLVRAEYFPYRTTLSKIPVDGLSPFEVHLSVLNAFGIIDEELECGEPVSAE